MGGDGAFSSASLLADEGDGLHSYKIKIPSFRYDGK
jgi:hypothetical protein